MFIEATKKLISPFLSLALLMLAFGYFMTYTSVRLKLDGESSFMIGLVASAYYFGFFVGALKVESFISRVKHIRAFAVFASIATASVMLQGLWINPYVWVVIRFFNGFGVAALFVIIESWFLVVSPDQYRGRVLSLYMVAIYSSSAISQFFMNFYDIKSLEPFILAGLISSLAILPVTLTRTTVPELHEPSPGMLWKLLQISPFGVGGCIAGGFLVSGIYSFLPVYAKSQDFSVPWVMFLAIMSAVPSQWPVGYFSDYMDRRKVMLGVCSLIIAASTYMVFFAEGFYTIIILTSIISGLAFTVYPMSITQACDRLPTHHLTTATGVLMLAYGIGAILGPLIASEFVRLFPPAGIYAYLGVVSIGVSVLAIASYYKRPAPLDKEKEYYVPMAATSPVASELDPRN